MDAATQDQAKGLFRVGEKMLFRTVTYHVLGRITARDGDFVALQDASWVADSGRFHEALENGTLSEVEYAGVAYVNLSAVTDAYPWPHVLPSSSK